MDAVSAAAHTLFHDMAQDFIKRQNELVGEIELLALAALRRIAEEVSSHADAAVDVSESNIELAVRSGDIQRLGRSK